MTTIVASYQEHKILYPDKIAIQTRFETIRYREWVQMVCQTANWLHSLEGNNGKIGILMPNGIPFLQLFSGTAMAGLISVPFDVKWKAPELKQRVTVSSPSIIITTESFSKNLKGIDTRIIIWEDACEQILLNPPSWNQEIDGSAPFYMGFTSGSTGVPKAFVRSHDSWIASFACNLEDFQLERAEHVLIPGALIHSHFLYGAVSTLYSGGSVYLLEKFSPVQTLKWVKTHPITVLYVVPTMIEAIAVKSETVEKPIKIISSGAKWEDDSKRRIQEQFHDVTIFEFYGASELSYVSVMSSNENGYLPGSVGKPCHNVEIQIRRENHELAGSGEIGKIYVKSDMIILGYLWADSPGIRSITDADGWATVDDLGYLDENGFLYIVGREKNMILYGGVNIFPEEIEAVLMEHPHVEEAAVIGASDPYWGQVPVAVIKGKASRIDLKKQCKEKLSAYKLPRKWYFVDEIPHTTSGKIARMRVKELIENEVNVH
jgi:long-chain acyl-CoA synthetase